MSRPRTRSKELDAITISVYLALVSIGYLMVTASDINFDIEQGFRLQSLLSSGNYIIYFTAIVAFFSCLIIDWKVWYSLGWIIYGVGILLLLAVLLVGVEIKGSTSWFDIFGFSFQPSEFAKFSTSLAVAGYLSSSVTTLSEYKNIFTLGAIILFPVLLILAQPDAGSALVFASFFVVLFRAGANSIYYFIALFLLSILILSLMIDPRNVISIILLVGSAILAMGLKNNLPYFLGILLLALFVFVFTINGYFWVSFGAAFLSLTGMLVLTGMKANWNSMILVLALVVGGSLLSLGSSWAYENILKPHQQDRINVWLNPEKCDPQGSLYNVNQSKTAIGSGGFLGKGFLEGEMTKLNYVPEQSTDFIFSTLGEEQGFIGVVGVIVLIVILLIRIVIIAERANNGFISNYAYCIFGFIFLQSFINIGMSMGVMPVIGIPLPFISKGGSSLLVLSLMLGILLKMDMERRRI